MMKRIMINKPQLAAMFCQMAPSAGQYSET